MISRCRTNTWPCDLRLCQSPMDAAWARGVVRCRTDNTGAVIGPTTKKHTPACGRFRRTSLDEKRGRCDWAQDKWHAVATIAMTSTAELVRLSRTSIADEMREEHRRRVLGESDRPRRRKAAGGHRGFEAVSNVHNEVTICALKPLREGETGHAHFWIPRRQLSDRLFFCASADRDGGHGACCSTRHNPIIASADSR